MTFGKVYTHRFREVTTSRSKGVGAEIVIHHHPPGFVEWLVHSAIRSWVAGA